MHFPPHKSESTGRKALAFISLGSIKAVIPPARALRRAQSVANEALNFFSELVYKELSEQKTVQYKFNRKIIKIPNMGFIN